MSKKREEELKQQREQELKRQQEEEKKIYQQEEEERIAEEKSLKKVSQIFEDRSLNVLAMFASSYLNVKNEPKRVPRYISYLSYVGGGLGAHFYLS